MVDIKTLRFLGADRAFVAGVAHLGDGITAKLWRDIDRKFCAGLFKDRMTIELSKSESSDQAALDSLELAMEPLAKTLGNVGALNPREHGDSRATSTRREVFVLEEPSGDGFVLLSEDLAFADLERAESYARESLTCRARDGVRVVRYVPEEWLSDAESAERKVVEHYEEMIIEGRTALAEATVNKSAALAWADLKRENAEVWQAAKNAFEQRDSLLEKVDELTAKLEERAGK